MASFPASPMEEDLANKERRIARLEELTFFQEQTIADLNEALTAQQTQMDIQEKRLALLEARFSVLWQNLNEDGGELTVPPHYL